ncbi:MAG: IS30 family transposase [Propionibacteriaceae bacterium]|nr:IS30 family transposase [Propionibacteriaceae bacterium]
MGQRYSQLTRDERNQFYALRKARVPMAEIARQLKRSPATLYRELKRNSGQRNYRPRQAHHRAVERRKARVRPLKMTRPVVEHIESKLSMQWSPEQIANTMADDPNGPGIAVSHETIYQHVWATARRGSDLYTHLRQRRKTRRKRRGTKDMRGKIRNRVGIEHRPAVVKERVRIGDWEADLICGAAHSGYLVTLVDRVSRKTRIGRTRTKLADDVTTVIVALLSSFVVETITFDNGKEFAGHEKIARQLECGCYFAQPYHSWERGLNENTNGLIRQYFPKKMEFTFITLEEIAFVEDRLNNRPRKCLGFKTPNAVYRSRVA